MSQSSTKLFVHIIWITYFTVVHCNEIASTTSVVIEHTQVNSLWRNEPMNESSNSQSSSSWDDILVQLNDVSILLWIIILLITVICCLCGTIFGFGLQRKLNNNQQLTNDPKSTIIEMEPQISSPLSGPHSVEHFRSFSSEMELKSAKSECPPMILPNLPRAKSEGTLHSNVSHLTNAPKVASPRSFNTRLNNGSTRSFISVTIPTLHNQDSSCEMTYITSHSNGDTSTQKSDQVPSLPKYNRAQSHPAKMYPHAYNMYNQGTPTNLTASAIAVTVPPPPYNAHESGYNHIQQRGNTRIQHNLQLALEKLSEDEQKKDKHLNPEDLKPKHTPSCSMWTDASLGVKTVHFKQQSTGFVGMIPHMFEHDDDDDDESSDDEILMNDEHEEENKESY